MIIEKSKSQPIFVLLTGPVSPVSCVTPRLALSSYLLYLPRSDGPCLNTYNLSSLLNEFIDNNVIVLKCNVTCMDDPFFLEEAIFINDIYYKIVGYCFCTRTSGGRSCLVQARN